MIFTGAGCAITTVVASIGRDFRGAFVFGKVFKMSNMNALDAEAEALLMAVKYAAHMGFHS